MKTEIRKLLGSDRLIIGTDRVLKGVRKGDVSKVILASNAPTHLQEQLRRYKELGATFEMEHAEMPNDELGTLCKKPFSIAVIAIRA
jgi:ribosomal protein L30E